MVLLTDGTVWGWGDNTLLRLGRESGETCTTPFGKEACSTKPIQVPVEGLVTLSVGPGHSCGCDKDGAAWCWGAGDSGKLSIPGTVYSSPPIQVQGFRCE
jgi:alpha-tubulin suppressor-like RCC1 family protein